MVGMGLERAGIVWDRADASWYRLGEE